jgi:hypothetical protein
VKQLQGFLGFANFYGRFIENFSRRATPLHKLLKKDEKWNWTESQEEAFQDLKTVFTTGPALVYLDTMKPLWIDTYA